MNRRRLPVIVGSLVALVVAGLATGFIRVPRANQDSRPPCDQLPSREEADRALSTHAEITERILRAGRELAVEVAMPCEGQNRALIRVSYSGGGERTAIQAVLQDGGFGVPVELVSRT